MVISKTNGLEYVRDLLKDGISHAQAGDDGTLPSENDTGLFSPVTSTKVAVTPTISNNPATITLDHIIPLPAGVGSNLQEWEVRVNGDAQGFNRTVTAPLAKVGTQEVIRIVTIEVVQD